VPRRATNLGRRKGYLHVSVHALLGSQTQPLDRLTWLDCGVRRDTTNEPRLSLETPAVLWCRLISLTAGEFVDVEITANVFSDRFETTERNTG